MQVQVFGKQNCAKCETTKHKVAHFITKLGLGGKVEMQFFDMETVEGLTEGAFRDVFDVPTTIIQNEGQDLARWEGTIPPTADIKKHLGTA